MTVSNLRATASELTLALVLKVFKLVKALMCKRSIYTRSTAL